VPAKKKLKSILNFYRIELRRKHNKKEKYSNFVKVSKDFSVGKHSHANMKDNNLRVIALSTANKEEKYD
jgi:hypothetical protein